MSYLTPQSVSYPAVVTGHVRAGNAQIIDGDVTARASINLVSTLTKNTWETIGPTGSGATNIWAEMDDIPAEATMLLVSVRMGVSTTDSNTAGLQVYVTEGDGTASQDLEDNSLAWFASDHDGAITGTDAIMFQTLIPLEPTNQDFRALWNSSSTDVEYAILYYRGFMTD